MGVRKIAFVASIALLTAAAPLPGGMAPLTAGDASAAAAKADTTASLSAADREKLLAQLKEHKKQVKASRKGARQDAPTQAAYDAKIKDLNRLIVGLERGQEFPMGEMHKALESPHGDTH